MKGFIEEFKEFINRGNVVDLAVAVIIGGAFTKIVNSVVNDVVMPLISLITGGIDFSEMKIPLGVGEDAAAFTYGNLINAVIQFLLIALVVFLLVKAINKAQSLRKTKEAEPEEEFDPPVCPFCLEEVKEGATRCCHCAGAFDAPAQKTPKTQEA